MVTTRPGGSDPSIHGSNGSVNISVQVTTALDSWIFNTTTQPAEFPFNGDINSGNPLGIGMFSLAHVNAMGVMQTFARLGSVLNRRRSENQCLGLIPHVELRYLN
ncbi:hypothetical protein EDB86DRAFT_2277357 [Lactarius hatsudake]|nr:hypothetical protein EDB86DRAFT_2277357 [Lactarius hatsudake]